MSRVWMVPLLFAGLLLAAPAGAETITPVPNLPGVTDETRAEARVLVEEMGITEQMRGMLMPMIQQTIRAMAQKNPGKSDQATQLVQDFIVPEFLGRLPELTDIITEIYASHFTVDDLHALEDFYRTPIGRKVLAEQPKIGVEINPYAIRWAQRAVADALRKHADEIKARGIVP